MNILFITWNFPPTSGGIEYVMGNLFEGFQAEGHQVRVITARSDVTDSPAGVYRVTRKNVFSYLFWSLFKAFSLCRASKPDVVVCGTLLTAPTAWLISRWYRVPSLVLIHGTDIIRGGKIYRCLARWFVARATRLAANSLNTKRLLCEAGIDADRIDFIPPGVRVDRFTPQATSLDKAALSELSADRKVLLIVGRLIRRKGVLEFVQQVMPTLVEQLPEVKLLVVGDDPKRSLAHQGEALRDRIESEVRRLGLEDHVQLLGEVTDDRLLAIYGRADLFVLPCLDVPGDVEGFGIVFLEAALTGAPAVSTRVGGIPEAVEDGQTGVLVEPGDFEAMGREIHSLLTDEPRRQALGQAAAKRARESFDWPIIVDAYEQSLRRCIDPDSNKPQEASKG